MTREGNYPIQSEASGVVHNVAADEGDAFRQIRRFLSYLPSNVWQLPPWQEPDDDSSAAITAQATGGKLLGG